MRGVTLLIAVALIALGAYLNSHKQVQVTSCNQVLQSCTQTSYPVVNQP